MKKSLFTQWVFMVLVSIIATLGNSGCKTPRNPFPLEVANKIIDSPYDVFVVVDGPGNVQELGILKPGQWLTDYPEFEVSNSKQTHVNVQVKFTVLATGELFIQPATLDYWNVTSVTVADKDLKLFDSTKSFSCKVGNGFWRINHRQRITAAGPPGWEYPLDVYEVGSEPSLEQLMFNIRKRGDREVPVTFTFTDIDTLPKKSISKIVSLSLDKVIVVKATEQDFWYR